MPTSKCVGINVSILMCGVYVDTWTCQHICQHKNKSVDIYVGISINTSRMCRPINVCQHLGANPNPKDPRQWSLFWGYIPKSEICFCTNLRHPSGLHAIRRIEKLLKSQMTWWVPLGWSRWRATKNSAVALSSRIYMISIHQRSARKNEGKITLI